MGCEDGSDVNASLSAKGKSHTSQPFMEMSNDGLGSFVADELGNG